MQTFQQNGNISAQTLTKIYGLDYDQETERLMLEQSNLFINIPEKIKIREKFADKLKEVIKSGRNFPFVNSVKSEQNFIKYLIEYFNSFLSAESLCPYTLSKNDFIKYYDDIDANIPYKTVNEKAIYALDFLIDELIIKEIIY
jgi:hypothetical protein